MKHVVCIQMMRTTYDRKEAWFNCGHVVYFSDTQSILTRRHHWHTDRKTSVWYNNTTQSQHVLRVLRTQYSICMCDIIVMVAKKATKPAAAPIK